MQGLSVLVIIHNDEASDAQVHLSIIWDASRIRLWVYKLHWLHFSRLVATGHNAIGNLVVRDARMFSYAEG